MHQPLSALRAPFLAPGIMERKTLTLLVALALALSGCLGSNGADDEDPDQLDHEDDLEPLQAILDANQTSGQAPLSVTFTLNATDHAPLDWSLDPDDGTPPFTGQTLPATIEHTYRDAGEHTPRFAIDAGNQTDQATLTLTVEPPVEDDEDDDANGDTANDGDDASTNGDDVPDPVTVTGTALIGHPFHPAECFHEGVDGDMHEIDPAQPGWAYRLEPTDTFAVYWWNGNEYLEPGDDAGTVPEGADTIELCLMEGNSEASYEVILHHPEHPDAP